MAVTIWSGTYQIEGDALTLTIETEAVKVTPPPEKVTPPPEADAAAGLIRRFRIVFFNPFSKTFIEVGDAGQLTLKKPGTSRGKMILEKR